MYDYVTKNALSLEPLLSTGTYTAEYDGYVVPDFSAPLAYTALLAGAFYITNQSVVYIRKGMTLRVDVANKLRFAYFK